MKMHHARSSRDASPSDRHIPQAPLRYLDTYINTWTMGTYIYLTGTNILFMFLSLGHSSSQFEMKANIKWLKLWTINILGLDGWEA